MLLPLSVCVMTKALWEHLPYTYRQYIYLSPRPRPPSWQCRYRNSSSDTRTAPNPRFALPPAEAAIQAHHQTSTIIIATSYQHVTLHKIRKYGSVEAAIQAHHQTSTIIIATSYQHITLQTMLWKYGSVEAAIQAHHQTSTIIIATSYQNITLQNMLWKYGSVEAAIQAHHQSSTIIIATNYQHVTLQKMLWKYGSVESGAFVGSCTFEYFITMASDCHVKCLRLESVVSTNIN